LSESLGRWVPDKLSPSGFRWQRTGEQPVTTMLPTVSADLDALYGDDEDDEPDHSGLVVVEPDELPSFDGIDSKMIRSIGAPE
jgi:hypothetical protein